MDWLSIILTFCTINLSEPKTPEKHELCVRAYRDCVEKVATAPSVAENGLGGDKVAFALFCTRQGL